MDQHLQANTTVNINIMDQNDCPPRFIQNEWHIELDENDDDDGDNQTDQSSSTTTTTTRTRTRNSTNNSFQSKMLLKLTVNDCDLPKNNYFTYKIIEEKWSSKPIISITDDHYYQGRQNEFITGHYFSIEPSSSMMMTNDNDNGDQYKQHGRLLMNKTTGIYGTETSALLLLNKPLDYEIPNHRFIMLKISVTDIDHHSDMVDGNGGEGIINVNDEKTTKQQPQPVDNLMTKQHTDICYIYITIRDINDNKPKFLKNFLNITIPESFPVGSIVAKFHAIDPDRNHTDDLSKSIENIDIYYSLDEQTNQRKYFQIDTETGTVRLNRKLDRETIAVHIVKIIATDLDDPPLTSIATLVINVDDVNDNAPFIINTTILSIRENQHPQQRLGAIYAFDRDDYSKGNNLYINKISRTIYINQCFNLQQK